MSHHDEGGALLSDPEPGLDLSRRDLIAALSVAGAAGWLAGCVQVEPSAIGAADAALPGELWRASAGELAGAIARGDVSSLEVLEAHLARIEAVNSQLNAVVRMMPEEARAAARAADEAVAAGDELGPLHGVPVSIKENVAVAGTPTTSGVRAFKDQIADEDAPLVQRLRSAGAIPFARTNLPDLGLRVHTDSYLHGLTRNPWAANRNVGGSSGGEGSALAAGMSPLGIGNDIGGSLRIPAQCCGIASLKPTFGRVPGEGGGFLSGQLMAVDGPMARRVEDLDTAFRVIAGPHTSDPWSMPIPIDLEKPASPIKVALVPEPSGGPTHPAIAEGVRKAGRALADAGYEVEEIEPPRVADAARVWGVFLASELSISMPNLREIMSPDSVEFLAEALELMNPGGLVEYAASLAQRHAIAAEMQEFQSRYPITVAPVLTEPPFEIGFDLEHPDKVLEQMRFEVMLNLLGLPAVCVPVGIDDEGMPQVVEVVGGRYREDLCLDAGQEIENAFGLITPIDPRA